MWQSVYIWLDDVREAPHASESRKCFEAFHEVATYEQAIELIEKYHKLGYCIFIDLDHDLGTEKSGYDVAKWIVENQINKIDYRIHSMNPVGVQNIRQLMWRYGYHEF